MTNREWLDTLTTEEFVHWLLDQHAGFCVYDNDGKIIEDHREKWSPTMWEIGSAATSSRIAIIEWLDTERKVI